MVTYYLLSQYGMKKRINMFGERGVRAVRKELDNLHSRKVIQPRLPRYLTDEQKIIYLSDLMFLKEKRNESTKGRGCADGRPQRLLIQK